jgi:hypothetical protein
MEDCTCGGYPIGTHSPAGLPLKIESWMSIAVCRWTPILPILRSHHAQSRPFINFAVLTGGSESSRRHLRPASKGAQLAAFLAALKASREKTACSAPHSSKFCPWPRERASGLRPWVYLQDSKCLNSPWPLGMPLQHPIIVEPAATKGAI